MLNNSFDIYRYRNHGLVLPKKNSTGFVGPEHQHVDTLFIGSCDTASVKPREGLFYWWEHFNSNSFNVVGNAGWSATTMWKFVDQYVRLYKPRHIVSVMPQYYSIDTFVHGELLSIMKQTAFPIRFMAVKKMITEEENAALMKLHSIQRVRVENRDFMRSEFCKLFDQIKLLQNDYKFTFRWTNSPSTTAQEAWSHILDDIPHHLAVDTFVGSVPLIDRLPDSSLGEKTQIALYNILKNDTP